MHIYANKRKIILAVVITLAFLLGYFNHRLTVYFLNSDFVIGVLCGVIALLGFMVFWFKDKLREINKDQINLYSLDSSIAVLRKELRDSIDKLAMSHRIAQRNTNRNFRILPHL